MLKAALRVEVGVAGEMNLAVLSDDGSAAVDENGRVEVASVGRELAVAERYPIPNWAARSNSGRVVAPGISRSNQESISA